MKTSDKIKVDIIIVNYNAGDFLIACLKSLEKVKDEFDNIFVVDNASTDNSLIQAKKLFPKLTYIENLQNLGFGKANNQAMKLSISQYILLLNPDSKVLPGTIKYMVDYMTQNLQVGAASCRVELQDGSLDWASHRGFPTPLASLLYFIFKNRRLYNLTDRDMGKAHEVDSIVGAFMLLRKSVLDQVGLFDADYFMYAEDIDLCYRIKQAGFKVMYVPQVKIIHLKGISSGIKKHSQQQSTATLELKKRSLDYFYSTMKIFYKKHLQQKYPFFINWLVYLGINLKWALAKRSLRV